MADNRYSFEDEAPVGRYSFEDNAPPPKANGSGFADGMRGVGAGLGKGLGTTVLGAQRLVGKGLQSLGDLVAPAPSITGLVSGKKERGLIQSAGDWLTADADQGRARLEAENAPYKAASPLMNGAGEVGGSIVATLPVGGLLPNALRAAGAARVAGALPRAAQAAGVGAVYGGVTGTTASTADTFGGMLGDGAMGAASGAALGGVTSPALSILGAVGGNVMQRASKSSAGEFAKQKVAEAFARDARGTLATGATGPIRQIAARFNKLGPEATLADAGGRNTFQLLDTLATLPGRTKDAAHNLLRQRTAGVGDRMRTSADEAFNNQGQRLSTTVQSLINQREQAAAPLYNQLRQMTIQPTQQLDEIVQAAEQLGATKLGREIATARQLPFTLEPGQPGRWSMSDLDHVKQGVDQVLSSRKAINADGTFTPIGHAYQSLKTKLIEQLDAATTNPQTGASLYRNARAAFSGPSALIDAANAGKTAITRDEAAITGMMNGMSAVELQAFRIGAFEGLRGKLGTQGGQTNIMNMWKEPATQEKLKAVFGDQRSYREFASSVAKEATLKRLQGVGTGSQTAARAAGMGDLDMSALSEIGAAAGAAKTGNLLGAVSAAKGAWNRVATPQTVRDQMGQMLLTKGQPAKLDLQSMESLIQQINARNLQLSRNVGVLGGGIGGRIVTPIPTLE